MILNLQNQEELSSLWAPPAAFLPSPAGAPGWMETALSHFFFTSVSFLETCWLTLLQRKTPRPAWLHMGQHWCVCAHCFCARNEAKLA